MRVGILADTHGAVAQTRCAIEILREAGADVLVHCGDLHTEEILEVCSVLPLYFVFGNHDSDMVGRLREASDQFGAHCLEWGGSIELAGRQIAVTHGHLKSEREPLQQTQPDFLLTGHTHEAADWEEDGVRRINPGALFRAKEYSVALLELPGGDLKFHHVPKLSYSN